MLCFSSQCYVGTSMELKKVSRVCVSSLTSFSCDRWTGQAVGDVCTSATGSIPPALSRISVCLATCQSHISWCFQVILVMLDCC